jgi:hypothetical protein
MKKIICILFTVFCFAACFELDVKHEEYYVSVSGIVTDSIGVPLYDCNVFVVMNSLFVRYDEVWSAQTDENGNFNITFLYKSGFNTYYIHAQKKDYINSPSYLIDIQKKTTVHGYYYERNT